MLSECGMVGIDGIVCTIEIIKPKVCEYNDCQTMPALPPLPK